VRRLLLALVCVAAAACSAAPMPATGTVEVAFTPWDDAEGALLRVISGARKSIRVQAFLFTSRPLARALIDAHHRGVDVAVLADREMALKGENGQLSQLAAAGIPVWLEVRYASAHNKILLVDATDEHNVVVTGSYNYTYSAQARNAENILILRGNAALARAYLENWQRHRADALPLADAGASK
jgi:phosphatidylserine/phosphatidylglycerophosphate/cardiolipin synthase-like enzyme